jgi:uncharacterized protein (TIGR02452 family)
MALQKEVKNIEKTLNKDFSSLRDNDFKRKKELLTKVYIANNILRRHENSIGIDIDQFSDSTKYQPMESDSELFRELSHNTIQKNGEVLTVNMTTTKAIRDFFNENTDIYALNFASRHTPGGGYTNGASAQEEDLCRIIPYLYPTLKMAQEIGLYPLYNSEVLYTPNLILKRDEMNGHYSLLPTKKYCLVNILSASAPRVKGKQVDEHILQEIFEKGIKNILLTPFSHNKEAWNNGRKKIIILGAWGCGAYGNDSSNVAKYFYNVLNNYHIKKLYDKLIFAVPETIGISSDSNSANFITLITKLNDLQVDTNLL